MTLEIPVFSVDDALAAAQYGAGRLELCSSYLEGGLTPGPGLLSYLKKSVSVPIFVMIRPKAGDFFYSPDDISVMKEEIRLFSDLGADGFVFGVLNRDKTVDLKTCTKLVQQAGGLPCTFHRAFDVVPDFDEALQQVIDCGFSRILTSGHPENVDSGLQSLLRLLKRADDQIIIMPGGGLRPVHLTELNQHRLLKEIHASCRSTVSSEHSTEFAPPITSSPIDPQLVEQFQNAMASLNH